MQKRVKMGPSKTPKGHKPNIFWEKRGNNMATVLMSEWESKAVTPTRNLPSKFDVLARENHKERLKEIVYIAKNYRGVSIKDARKIVDTLGFELGRKLVGKVTTKKVIFLMDNLGKETLVHLDKGLGVEGILNLVKKYDLGTVKRLSNIPDHHLHIAVQGLYTFGARDFFRINQEVGGIENMWELLVVGPKNVKRLVGATGPRVAFKALSVFKGENKVRRILRESKTNDQIREKINQLIFPPRK